LIGLKRPFSRKQTLKRSEEESTFW
jgi:hypothetical protein